jgi:hypothetical protein
MDRNLLDADHAWAQMLVRMQRSISSLEARVGSTALITSAAATVSIPSWVTPLGNTVALIEAAAPAGRWKLDAAVTVAGTPTASSRWVLSAALFDRATALPITPSDTILPAASINHGSAPTVSEITLTSFGWTSIEPSDNPDGFITRLYLAAPGASAWPAVTNARLALSPF